MYLFSKESWPGSGAHPSSCSVGTWCTLLQGVKWLWCCEVHVSPQLIADSHSPLLPSGNFHRHCIHCGVSCLNVCNFFYCSLFLEETLQNLSHSHSVLAVKINVACEHWQRLRYTAFECLGLYWGLVKNTSFVMYHSYFLFKFNLLSVSIDCNMFLCL